MAFDIFWQFMSAENYLGLAVAIWTSHLGAPALGFILFGPLLWVYNRAQSVVYPAIIWTGLFSIFEFWVPTPAISLQKGAIILGLWAIYFGLARGGRRR